MKKTAWITAAVLTSLGLAILMGHGYCYCLFLRNRRFLALA